MIINSLLKKINLSMLIGDMEMLDQRAVTKRSSCWVQLCVQLGGEELKSYMQEFLSVQFSFCFL